MDDDPVAEQSSDGSEPSRDEQHSNLLNYLLKIDFSKHIDLMEMAKFRDYQLTEDDECIDLNQGQLNKVLKMIMYRIGIQDEKQNEVTTNLDKKFDSRMLSSTKQMNLIIN
jgi:hypothetical protein